MNKQTISKQKLISLLVGAVLLTLTTACGTDLRTAASTLETVEQSASSGEVTTNTVTYPTEMIATTQQAEVAVENNEDNGTSSQSAADLAAQRSADRTDADATLLDVSDNSAAVHITLEGDSATIEGDGATYQNGTVRIAAATTYYITGSLSDGQIIVDTEGEEPVVLILDGVDIRTSAGPAIYVINAQETVIVLADQSENYVADGAAYAGDDTGEDTTNAAIFSEDDLVITGDGSLTVEANYNDGIASKDGLTIVGGTISVRAIDDGIRGKDYLVVENGTLTVEAGGDGLKSDNDADATVGYILIQDGLIDITSGGDAISAQSDVLIADGQMTITSGGGSQARLGDTTSAKGIKGLASVVIDSGVFHIDAADDGVHSNDSITINGGTFTIATGDDGMHADSTLDINGGDIAITRSYEGIESAQITINAGDIHIVSSDDGINVVGGNDGSGMMGRPGGGRPGRGGTLPGQDMFASTGDYYLEIDGGYIVVDADGDGLDVNGFVEMTDGVVLISGPTEQNNGALDHASFNISGGLLVAAGSAGMAQAPSQGSAQEAILVYFDTTLRANTLVRIQTTDGEDILTFAPAKAFQSIAFSSPELKSGVTYDIYYGGTSSGTVADGLYQGGAYTGGTEYLSFGL